MFLQCHAGILIAHTELCHDPGTGSAFDKIFTWVQSLGWKDPLEKGEATHSSILAWRISRTV